MVSFSVFSSVHLASLSLSGSQQRSTNIRLTPETKLPFTTPNFQLTSNYVFTQMLFNLTSSVFFSCPVYNGLLWQNFDFFGQLLGTHVPRQMALCRVLRNGLLNGFSAMKIVLRSGHVSSTFYPSTWPTAKHRITSLSTCQRKLLNIC